ncbi:MAG: UPF0175 family protein [Chloroflexota bacterium]
MPATKPSDKAEWQSLSEAIVRVGAISSLDHLLHQALDMWINQLSTKMRWQIATDLYRIEEVSLGRAAEIAGIPYVVFMERLAEDNIPLMVAESTTEEQRTRRKGLIHAGFNLTHA